MKTPLVQYDREANMILLHPVLINALKLLGYAIAFTVLLPVTVVILLLRDKR